jgi:hypothetical protein
MKQEKKTKTVEQETRTFQHGFVVGFMNGARSITEAFRAALDESIETALAGDKATDVYLEHSCRNPGCLNFRPGSAGHCSPACEATESAWHAAVSTSAMVH